MLGTIRHRPMRNERILAALAAAEHPRAVQLAEPPPPPSRLFVLLVPAGTPMPSAAVLRAHPAVARLPIGSRLVLRHYTPSGSAAPAPGHMRIRWPR